jgi:hypothetical protein
MLEGLAVEEYRLTGKENHSGTVNETLGQSETGLMIETEDLTETEDTDKDFFFIKFIST